MNREEVISNLRTIWAWAESENITSKDSKNVKKVVSEAIRVLEADEAAFETLESLVKLLKER